MATAAPHVKLLRQLASAKDDYLSGAFDVSWDGARATLYLVFGRPSHAVFEINQAQIEGEAAIDALLAELPKVFAVSDWRRAMSPRETLSITIDELAGPFVRLAGSYADDPIADESPEWWSAIDDSPDLPFGLADFPLMPGGRPLWVEASPDEVRLAERLSELPPSILVLTGAKLRAAAVVSGGDLIDAVWIDADDHARGETAGMALLGATKGSLAGYALDDPRVAEALTMIWRLPLAVRGVDLAWLDPASMLAAFHADGLDRVLVIDAPVRGIALFSRGGLVAVYSETQRSAVASPERLRSLLSQARGRLTVMERKPRPLAADATPTPATAYEFFEVAPPETPATPAESAEAEPVLDAQGAEAIEAVPALDAVGAEPAVDAVAPPPPPSEAVLAGGEAPPPPPPPAAESLEPSRPARRSRWGFRRNRRSRQEVEPAEDIAAVPSDASDAAGAPTAGWSIRQPNVDPAPVWHRALDAGGGPPIDSEPVAGPDPATQPAADHETHPPDIAPDEPAAEPAEPPSHDTQPLDFASDQPVAEPAAPAASDDWLSSSWLDDVVDGGAGESITEADAVDGDAGASMTEGDATAEPDLAAPADGQPESGLEPVSAGDSEASEEPSRAVSIFRTPGPWVWPLAEPEQPTGVANGATSPPTHPSDDPDAQNLEPASAGASGDQDDAPVLEGGAEPEFFHRDEPVGSKYVDFDEVRDELVRIGVVWLGEANAVPVTALLNSTRSTIDDFVATIDTIRGLHLEGQDPASIQAMAREMHQQAAERLSGA